MELVTKKLNDIRVYENNPRYNLIAVDAVEESIKQCEYIAPIVLDEDDVILAGHTRYMALRNLGYEEAECIVIDGLTDEQKRMFRLLDNKTGEEASWDYDKLTEELKELNLGDFHWLDDLTNPNINLAADKSRKKDESAGEDIADEEGVVRCPKCGATVYDSRNEEDYDEDDDDSDYEDEDEDGGDDGWN